MMGLIDEILDAHFVLKVLFSMLKNIFWQIIRVKNQDRC